ncbi:DNA-processing protein DprA [Isoptericola sp. b441]|uniref:DNA-processing protein DprA n=1 Tax=Actinotalea lenta TaxID=3064654 RepID=A0ABT9DD94_9CELL|nr:DNA-processing protein DprA [Isoptericola sp. b441]MDO8107336.1 DNA-processing protein DprA [Isoptericola sp. b441]
MSVGEVPQDRLARAAWSGLAEPGDPVAGALVEVLGPSEALALVADVAADPGAMPALPPLGSANQDRVRRSLLGWAARWQPGAARDWADWVTRLGGKLVVPGDPGWATRLDDLGHARPMCLWAQGDDSAELWDRTVSVVGARAATGYGEHVTAELVAGLVDAGVTVVSGGAFGIDAVAHRAAVAAGGRTAAVLAGGLDRPYPAGNARLLSAVAASGTVVCEVPPGRHPTRHRFLLRNRVIAAAGAVTVVVEAAWRSGALSTAGHAVGLLRPVAAVPGPVTSAASAGCHRLLRDGAVCVSDAAEVLELLDGTPSCAPPTGPPPGPHERMVHDALPLRGERSVEALGRECGLAAPDVLEALGSLELAGRATCRAGRWRRA